MKSLFAILELSDYLVIAAIVFIVTGGAALARRQPNGSRLERKLDALLKHQGVEIPSRLSPEVQRLAADPATKIAAIKLHRQQNPGLGLADAKAEIEDFASGPS